MKSRFHDGQGNLIDFAGALYAPRALTSAIVRKISGYRPAMPWISYRATRFLDQQINREWRVIEFGSGMSTLWFAARCGYLHSIESDERWYKFVSQRLAGAKHVRYELRPVEQYPDVGDYADRSVDFALVDGIWRAGCVESVAPKIRAGGYLYLDNSDLEITIPDGDIQRAAATAINACEARGGRHKYFVDFRPGEFGVTQGLLIQFGS